MEIDYGLLMTAVSSHAKEHGFSLDTGYLNRHTGEILFLGDPKKDTEACMGDAAAEMVHSRADIESRPDIWIAIPKYQGESMGPAEEEEQFALDWLASCGLGDYTIQHQK